MNEKSFCATEKQAARILNNMSDIIEHCKELKITAFITVMLQNEDKQRYIRAVSLAENVKNSRESINSKENNILDFIENVSDGESLEYGDSNIPSKHWNCKLWYENDGVKKKVSSDEKQRLIVEIISFMQVCKTYGFPAAFGMCLNELSKSKNEYYAQILSPKILHMHIPNNEISKFTRYICGYEQAQKKESQKDNAEIEDIQSQHNDFEAFEKA